MTIRRQYSLPNCTLVLDGFSDSSSNSGIPDSRPLMSNLFNAECHFVGREQPLSGGREFLTSLIASVSDYAQEFLSGIPHSVQPPATSLVTLSRGEREHTHHLQATLDVTGSNSAGEQTQVDLSTVQLFDLLEAIDQFLADQRTLPDIMVPLQPIGRASAQPISAQAVPAGLGLASLIVAGLIGYSLPIPQVSAPKSTPTPIVTPTTPRPTTTPPAPTSTAPTKTGK